MSVFLVNALNRIIHENPEKAVDLLHRLAEEAKQTGHDAEAYRFQQEAEDVQQMMAA